MEGEAYKELATDLSCMLASLADDLETEDDVERLARTLGFKPAEINRHIATNRLEGRVTCRGTRDMLLAWRQRVPPDREGVLARLRQALLQANLVRLADQYCGNIALKRDVYSTEIAPGITFEYCIETLKSHYRKVMCKMQRRPWDPRDYIDFDEIFTELSLSGYGNSSRNPFSVSVKDVFSIQTDGERSKRILLIAPGGHGKTCAIAKMAYDWAYEVADSPMRNIPALFILRLREVEEEMGLGEAIISQLLGSIPGVTPEVVENFTGLHESHCALLFDGYDEYNKTLQDKSDPPNSLLQVLQNKRLKRSQVLVTTRPYLEEDFMNDDLARVYTKVELKGFTREHADQYIKRYFESRSNPEAGTRLTETLTGDSFLAELIVVPLFCTVLCHLHHVRGNAKARTVSDLFRNINSYLLHHSMTKSARRNTLPQGGHDVEGVIEQLGGIAFQGVLRDSRKLRFQKEDFHGCEEAYQTGLQLGILSATTSHLENIEEGQTTETSVEFFHRWEQDYCISRFLQGKCLDSQLTHQLVARSGTLPFKIRSSAQNAKKRLSRVLSQLHTDGSSSSEPTPSRLISALEALQSPGQTIEFQNILRLVASGGSPCCRAIFKHIAKLNWEGRHFAKCRLLIDCQNEAKVQGAHESSVPMATKALSRCFRDGRLFIENMTGSMLSGLEDLPPKVKSTITVVYIKQSLLSERLLACLSTFSRLWRLTLIEVTAAKMASNELSASNHGRHNNGISIRELEMLFVEPDAFRQLLLSQRLSSLESLEVWVRTEAGSTGEIFAITHALTLTERTLKTLTILGNTTGKPNIPDVDSTLLGSRDMEVFQEFGRAISRASGCCLHSLCLKYVKWSETKIITTIEACQRGSCIQEVRLHRCCSYVGNVLRTFLDNISVDGRSRKQGVNVSIDTVREGCREWTISRLPPLTELTL